MKTLKIATLGLAGLVTTGLIAFQAPSANADGDGAFKRNEDTPDVVMAVDDDDDDDTGARDRDRDTRSKATRSNNTRSKNTGTSRSTRDNTNSRFTKVSRDRDLSRSDKTRTGPRTVPAPASATGRPTRPTTARATTPVAEHHTEHREVDRWARVTRTPGTWPRATRSRPS